jgi:hypothetical protein
MNNYARQPIMPFSAQSRFRPARSRWLSARIWSLYNISSGYELRVTGFDTNRDLELRLETVTT